VDVFPSHTLPTLPYPMIHPSLLAYGAQCRAGIIHTSQELYRAGDAMFHEEISGCVLYSAQVMVGGGRVTAWTVDGVCPRDFFSVFGVIVAGMG